MYVLRILACSRKNGDVSKWGTLDLEESMSSTSSSLAAAANSCSFPFLRVLYSLRSSRSCGVCGSTESRVYFSGLLSFKLSPLYSFSDTSDLAERRKYIVVLVLQSMRTRNLSISPPCGEWSYFCELQISSKSRQVLYSYLISH